MPSLDFENSSRLIHLSTLHSLVSLVWFFFFLFLVWFFTWTINLHFIPRLGVLVLILILGVWGTASSSTCSPNMALSDERHCTAKSCLHPWGTWTGWSVLCLTLVRGVCVCECVCVNWRKGYSAGEHLDNSLTKGLHCHPFCSGLLCVPIRCWSTVRHSNRVALLRDPFFPASFPIFRARKTHFSVPWSP